jgi:hypothetical protein
MSLSILLLYWLIRGNWLWRPLSLVLLGQSLPWIGYPCSFRTITFLACTWLCQTSKTTVAILASFPMAPHSLCLQLSHGSVLTGWRARSNCNLVLSCTGSSRCFISQKLQDGKHISFSKSMKRPLCNIHRNRWCITRGTQSERMVLPLESHSYNKSHPRPKAFFFTEIDDRKHFLVVSNPCLTSLHHACISFTPAQGYSLIRIYLWATSCGFASASL